MRAMLGRDDSGWYQKCLFDGGANDSSTERIQKMSLASNSPDV